MTWQVFLLDANAIVCLLIVLRLMFFSKLGKRQRFGVSLLAYLTILAAGYTSFRILMGTYIQVDPGELMLNSIICASIWLARGNLAKVVMAG